MSKSTRVSGLLFCTALLVNLGGCQTLSVKDSAPLVKNDNCKRIGMGSNGEELVIGPEDIAVDPKSGLAYISATDRWAIKDYQEDRRLDAPRGGIYRYDPSSGSLVRMKIVQTEKTELSKPDGFYPHGIDLRSDGGETRLFVVNHPLHGKNIGNAVAVFRVKGDELETDSYHPFTPQEGPRDAQPGEAGSFNEVAALDAKRFYVSFNRNSIIRVLFANLFPIGEVLFFDEKKGYRSVLKGLAFANGIALDSKSKRLFVTDSIRKTLSTALVIDSEGSLGPRNETISFSGMPDNLSLVQGEGEDQRLLVAVHGSGLKFILHAAFRCPSPGEVIAIPAFSGGIKDEGERLFHDSDGTRNPGTSAAALSSGHLLIGNVYSKGFYDCSLP